MCISKEGMVLGFRYPGSEGQMQATEVEEIAKAQKSYTQSFMQKVWDEIYEESAKMEAAERKIRREARNKAILEVKAHVDKIEIGVFRGSGHCELMLSGIKVKLDDMLEDDNAN